MLSDQVDTTTADSCCTNGCTSESETVHAANPDALAAMVLGLSSEDRARLAALLESKGE
jgi:hypothetical protein